MKDRKALVMGGLFMMIIVGLVYSDGARDFIESGDRKAKLYDYEKALLDYKEAVKLDPQNAEANWKVGWAHNRLALNSTGETRNYHFGEASNALSRAINIDKSIAYAHVELARSLVYSGLLKDNWDSYTLAKRVKEELDYALKLDPKLADAYFLLGLWHRQVSRRPYLWRRPLGLGEANKDDELKNLKRAVELEPNRIEFLLELGKSYIDRNDNSNARVVLKNIETIQPRDPYERILRDEGLKLLSRISQ